MASSAFSPEPGGNFTDKGAEYFGYVIAYLLPGLVGLWGAAYLSPIVMGWMSSAAAQSTSVGGFLFLMVSAVGIGVGLQTLRWAFFEVALPRFCSEAFCDRWQLNRPKYDEKRASEPGVQSALVDMRDQHYRYYQSNGALALAVPFVFAAWIFYATNPPISKVLIFGFGAMAFAILSGFAALDAQRRMRNKRFALLTGGRKQRDV